VITAHSKVYNGTTAATLSSESLSGTIYGSDAGSLGLTYTAASFNSKDVLTATTVTATGLSLTGSAAFDYRLSSTSATAAASITPATLTASLTGTVEKTYDGTTNATLAPANYRLAGILGGNTVILNDPASGRYDTPDAGTGKTVTVSGLGLSGAQAADYRLAATTISGPVGVIIGGGGGSPVVVTVTASNETRLYGTAMPALAYTYSDGGGTVDFSGALSTAATRASAPGSYAITQGSLTAPGNYDIVFTPGTLTVLSLPNTVQLASSHSFIATASEGVSVSSAAQPQPQNAPTSSFWDQNTVGALTASASSNLTYLHGLIYANIALETAFGLEANDISSWADGILPDN